MNTLTLMSSLRNPLVWAILGCFSLVEILPLSAAERRNLLFILTEDQGAHLGVMGTPGLQTPNMDAIAEAGVLFRNAFVAYPVCSASKAAIYTSMHNHSSGLLNNTVNYHQPAAELSVQQKQHELYVRNRIRDDLPTLVERLQQAGYYQGVSHKLHVSPNEKFPYDDFLHQNNRAAVAEFMDRAAKANKPWHLFYNVPNSHRPFPNSDRVKIRVQSSEVALPAFLPDTPVIRQDWSEYLAAIEEADRYVGEALAALRESGQYNNTIIVFMGDHGPCFPHGKMTLYDLGLRVPLVVRLPEGRSGVVSEALASELDLFPTLLDLLGLPPLAKSHGMSLRPVIDGTSHTRPRQFVFAEISNRGTLPNDGMQERSVFDGQWHLIYREKVETRWRQVQADSKEWQPWGNRSYGEIVRVRDNFPQAYRILQELDPQSLDGHVPRLELYDLKTDPDEVRNLVDEPGSSVHRERLMEALRSWCRETEDLAVNP